MPKPIVPAIPSTETAEPQASLSPGLPPELPASAANTFIARVWLQCRQHGVLLGFLLTVLMVAAVAGPRLLFGPEVALVVVIQRDFVQSVVASGRVETPHRVNIGVQITGTVAEVPVLEGQMVSIASPLIQLESAELAAAVTQASRSVEHAQAELRHLKEVIAPSAEQTLREAQANQLAAFQSVERNRTFFSQGMISRSILDESDRLERGTRSKVSSLQLQWQSTQVEGSQTALGQAALLQATAGLALAKAKLSYSTVHAPVAGVLIARNVEPGDVVQPGKVLMQLSPTAPMQLVVQIDEKNLHFLALHQRAQASADAYPEQNFSAELIYINPGIDAVRGAVEVKLRVGAPPSYLRQDMTVSVDIAVAFRANAVLVPSDAVHDSGSEAPWVLKLVGGRAQRQVVSLGLRSLGWTEVLSGVRPGDKLVPLSANTLVPGRRIREQTLVTP